MQCPVCDVPLIVVERSQIELDYCPLCKGSWFDEGELQLLSKTLALNVQLPNLASLPAIASQEKARPCPRCSKKMDKIEVAQVLVDRCRSGHGLWFDWGEVGSVLEKTLENTGGEKAVVKFLSETIRVGNKTDAVER